ncbi:hypothetical protein AFLA70_276g000801 [Aspergillus flavus AF70]|nr:hypothetical protein AFLA70_276g000801 [Aspergillus flavus AF70]
MPINIEEEWRLENLTKFDPSSQDTISVEETISGTKAKNYNAENPVIWHSERQAGFVQCNVFQAVSV